MRVCVRFVLMFSFSCLQSFTGASRVSLAYKLKAHDNAVLDSTLVRPGYPAPEPVRVKDMYDTMLESSIHAPRTPPVPGQSRGPATNRQVSHTSLQTCGVRIGLLGTVTRTYIRTHTKACGALRRVADVHQRHALCTPCTCVALRRGRIASCRTCCRRITSCARAWQAAALAAAAIR